MVVSISSVIIRVRATWARNGSCGPGMRVGMKLARRAMTTVLPPVPERDRLSREAFFRNKNSATQREAASAAFRLPGTPLFHGPP